MVYPIPYLMEMRLKLHLSISQLLTFIEVNQYHYMPEVP